MAILVILTEPTYLGGTDTIELNVERLTYDIDNEIQVTPFVNRDSTMIMDIEESLLSMMIDGKLKTTTDMEALLTATNTWWTDSADDMSDATKLPKITWRGRTPQYMTIKRLEITDLAETDDHDFEFSMELAVDTRVI